MYLPSGSTIIAIYALEFDKSAFAGEPTRMMHVSCLIYDKIIVLIQDSISEGWSPTGTLFIPGNCTRVILRTFGENIFNRICLSETPLFTPTSLSVSSYTIWAQRKT